MFDIHKELQQKQQEATQNLTWSEVEFWDDIERLEMIYDCIRSYMRNTVQIQEEEEEESSLPEKNKKRAKRRFKTRRIICRRVEIEKSRRRSWRVPVEPTEPGKYKKWNLACSCFVCKPEKVVGLPTLQDLRHRASHE